MIDIYSYFGGIKFFMYLATWYIGRYTPDTQKHQKK